MSTTENTSVLDNDHFPATITQSRIKAAVDLFWAVMVASWAISGYESNLFHTQAWSPVLLPLDAVAVVVCSLCAISSFIEIVKPPRLILDPQGITERSLFRTHTISWRDVHNFRSVRALPFGQFTFIMFDYVRPRAVHPILRALNRRPGTRSTLGPGWAIKGERLAALLNAGRHLWGGAPQPG